MLFYDYLWLEKSIICTICFPSSILNASLKKRHYIELCAVWWIWNRLNWGTEYPKLQKKKKKVSRPYLSPCRPHRWSLRSPHLFAPSDAVVTNHTVPLLDSLGPPEKQIDTKESVSLSLQLQQEIRNHSFYYKVMY